MGPSRVNPDDLVDFAGAAGHAGVRTDAKGELFIKPCTAKELQFYESLSTKAPDLLPYIPAFMGKLERAKQDKIDVDVLREKVESTGVVDSEFAGQVQVNLGVPTLDGGEVPVLVGSRSSEPASKKARTADGTSATLGKDDPGPMHGKALDTKLSIVLENSSRGFRKPNVLDVKLGKILYEPTVKQEKKERLDKVAAESTTGSLGFRIAGMRTWGGLEEVNASPAEKDLVILHKESNYKEYNKMYGRTFTAENVERGFEEFFIVPAAGIDSTHALATITVFIQQTKDIIAAFEKLESRMYSASLLYTYEGDPAAHEEAARFVEKVLEKRLGEDEDDEDEDEDEFPISPLVVTKVIDFAHASWTPGEGPDENALKGMRNTLRILEDLHAKLEKPVI